MHFLFVFFVLYRSFTSLSDSIMKFTELLSLQLHMKQLAGEKLLPLLENMDPLDRSG